MELIVRNIVQQLDSLRSHSHACRSVGMIVPHRLCDQTAGIKRNLGMWLFAISVRKKLIVCVAVVLWFILIFFFNLACTFVVIGLWTSEKAGKGLCWLVLLSKQEPEWLDSAITTTKKYMSPSKKTIVLMLVVWPKIEAHLCWPLNHEASGSWRF